MILSAYNWVIEINYATSKYQDKRYRTMDSAQKACAASHACKGVYCVSGSEFYLANGDGTRAETEVTT